MDPAAVFVFGFWGLLLGGLAAAARTSDRRRAKRHELIRSKTRLVLAEVLLADDQPGEALQQLGFIALPRADEPWDGDTPRLAGMHAQISLLRGQYDEAMKHLDEASPLTRARVLAAAGHELPASEILRQLSRAELETIHRRYSTEPAGALALQLISGPYR